MHPLNIDPLFLERAKRARGGRLNAYQALRSYKTALVVIDMQEYYVADGMPFSATTAQKIVPNITDLRQPFARQAVSSSGSKRKRSRVIGSA